MMPAIAVTPHPFSLGADENPYPAKEQDPGRIPATLTEHISAALLQKLSARGLRHRCCGTTRDDHQVTPWRPSCQGEYPYSSASIALS
jgi:hypothetical protein